MSKKFAEAASRLDNLAEDYRLSCLSVQAAKSEAAEIAEAISARLQQEQNRNAERREELKVMTTDASRSEVVKKMAALELEKLEEQAPAITEEERALFDAKIGEANNALKEVRRIEAQLVAARSDLKKLLDANFKPSALFPVDATLLSRQLDGAKETFERQYGRQV